MTARTLPAPGRGVRPAGLRLHRVKRAFGGLVAIDDLSLDIAAGSITGIIGPNGAGKSTLFNVISGIYPADSGTVQLDDVDMTRRDTAAIACLGVARSFQSTHTFGRMTVLQNVLIGQAPLSGATMARLIPFIDRGNQRRLRREALDLLDEFGLAEVAHARVGNLAYATQRRVELVRALAGRPRIILVDEPAAGLNDAETAQLEADLRLIRDRGTTVVLVEHDMSLVMNVCEEIAVLDFGRLLSQGTPAEVSTDEKVIRAYLGG